MKFSKESKGTILAVLTALVSGVSIIANKFFVSEIDPVIFTASRALLISLIFLAMAYFTKSFDTGRIRKVSWRYLLPIGIIGGGVAFLLFFTGLSMTTGGRAAFLHKTLPLWATILSFVFLREKVSRKQAFGMAAMFGGLIVLESGSISLGFFSGDMLVVAAAMLWAVENVLAKKAMKMKESNWTVSFARMGIGGLFLSAVLFLTGDIGLIFSLTAGQIIYILVSSLFLTCYVAFWYRSLKYINVSKASSILLLAPVVSLSLGFFALGETVTATQMAGSALILAGAYTIIRSKSESRMMENE